MSDSTDSVPKGSGGSSDPTKKDETELNAAQAVLNNPQEPAPSPASVNEADTLDVVDSQNVGLIAPLAVAPDEQFYEKDLDPARRLTPQSAVYLDHVERVKAEVARAAVEGREPDLENPGPYSGAPLRRADQIHNPANQNLSFNMLSQKSVGKAESTNTGQEPGNPEAKQAQDNNPQDLNAIGNKAASK